MSNFCYYNPDNHYIVGVAKKKMQALAQYFVIEISDEEAKPFYAGERGYNGPWQILFEYKKPKIVKDVNYNTRTTKDKKPKKLGLAQVELFNQYEPFEYLLIPVKDKTKIVDIKSTLRNQDYNITFYITEKNNPFKLLRTVEIENKEGIIDISNDELFNKTILTRAGIGTVQIFTDEENTKRPFNVYNIDNNTNIIEPNIGALISNKTKRGASILIGENNVSVGGLLGEILIINDEDLMLNNKKTNIINIDKCHIPENWLGSTNFNTTNPIIFRKNNIFYISTKNINVAIVEKNNPLKVIDLISTKDTRSVIINDYNDYDFMVFDDSIRRLPIVELSI